MANRLTRWYHETFDDWAFRSLIGPAQTQNAIQGCDKGARDQWKQDLDNRKRHTREQRERKRLLRETQRNG